MTFKKTQHANIYVVTGIMTVLVIFSMISFIIIEDNITNGSSAQIIKEQLLQNR